MGEVIPTVTHTAPGLCAQKALPRTDPEYAGCEEPPAVPICLSSPPPAHEETQGVPVLVKMGTNSFPCAHPDSVTGLERELLCARAGRTGRVGTGGRRTGGRARRL